MTLHLRLDRWYLGLHGLALLRSYPFGDLDGVEARKEAMRSLLAGEGPEWLFETTEVEELPAGLAYEAWAATYDDPNPLIATEERELLAVIDQVPPGDALDVATGTGRIARHLTARGHRVVASDRVTGMVSITDRELPDVWTVAGGRCSAPDEGCDLRPGHMLVDTHARPRPARGAGELRTRAAA